MPPVPLKGRLRSKRLYLLQRILQNRDDDYEVVVCCYYRLLLCHSLVRLELFDHIASVFTDHNISFNAILRFFVNSG
jgi:hypothetical protein